MLLRWVLAARRLCRRRRLRDLAEDRHRRWRATTTPPGGVAVLGDSLVAAMPDDLLRAMAGDDAFARGGPGETIAELGIRLDEALDRAPSAVVLQVGTNDVLRGRPLAWIRDEYAELIARCRRARPGASIVVASLPPIAPWRVEPTTVTATNAVLRELADAAAVGYADSHSVLSLDGARPRGDCYVDSVHLSATGYARMAHVIGHALAGDGRTP